MIEREQLSRWKGKKDAETPGCGVVVIKTVWIQFSSHGKLRLRPFAANISKVNQSYLELRSFSSLFC